MQRIVVDELVVEGGLRTTGANPGARREPDTTARSYLQAIANDPEQVEQAYAPTKAATE